MPRCADWPKPKALGFPNAELVLDGELPNVLEPNVAPPVDVDAGGALVDAAHGEELCPSCEEFPKAGAAIGVVDEPNGEAAFAGAEGVDVNAGWGVLSIIARPG
jgi:hypothetical protein